MAGRLRSHRSDNIWPGFVDALATLLLVIMFLLVVFVLAHVFLSQALSGRDEALERLNNQISELANLLALEQDTSTELRTNVSQLSASLQQSTKSRDALGLEMETLRAQLADANQALAERDDKIASTGSDRDALAARIARLEAALAQSSNEAAALRAQARDLQDELVAAEVSTAEKLAALQAAMVARLAAQEADAAEKLRAAEERRLATDEKLKAASKKSADDVKQLDEERKVSTAALGQVALLNQQLAALRLQMARVNQALEASEAQDRKQKATILDLGKRLNVALAKKVEELAQFRSEFFGRLKKALGSRRDVQVVGDRFVFQSEVLFTSGSAELGLPGKDQLAKLAATILDIARKIPSELPWVLRVDGHTDRFPIATARFPSNWALSTGRALSVVNFLIEQGVPPNRLAAAGFGEFQPLDKRDDEIAHRRNRRIEIKLTQR